jgi:DNA-binding winged helix-turn-helix (wHTH) protein
MKIVVNTDNNELLNMFIKLGKETDHQIISAKSDSTLFEQIENNSVDAYVLSNNTFYFKKAVEFIKKNNPYVPIIGMIISESTFNVPVDIYLDQPMRFEGNPGYYFFAEEILYNISAYTKTFATLKKLTTKMHEKIEFANCVYDPSRRIFYHGSKEIKKLSVKEGGILEILAVNYGEVVKKEVILEKVWRKTDYFCGRSCDVYITYLRNIFRDNNIKLNIKNISGIGLILE